jgi:molecular chaperone DnaK (HSP70)
VRGKEVVGSAARRQAVTDPAGTVTAVKRLIGHGYDSPEIQAALRRAPYPIRPSPLGNVLLEVGGKELTPVQVSARILHRLRELAEQSLGERVARAVISVPAHFTDVQRKATKLAAEYAGLEVARLINEPTAAAFAYGYKKGENFTLAVYDLGGGTFDITVLTARGDRFEVDATDGDSYLGGEDFDHAIIGWLKAEFEAEFGHPLGDDQAAHLRLKEAAELAKIELSEVDAAEIELPFLTELPDGTRPHFTRTFTRDKLRELTQSMIERTLELCAQCLQESGLRKDDVDEVLLVGGQTRMPQIRERVREFFGKEPRRDINPDEVVAMGAALYGYSLEAGDLKDQAEEAAEDAYAVAVRGSAVARKMVNAVAEMEGSKLDDDALAARLESLLNQAETTVSSDPTSATVEPEDLPAAVSKVDEELYEIRRKTAEVVRKLRDGRNLPVEKALEMARRLEEFVESARSASVQAQSYLSEVEEHARASKLELIDVTSHALGIAAAGDVFSALIKKNAPVPIEESRVFTTHQNGQTEVEIRVSQGSKRRASQNQGLGAFVLEGIPPLPRMTPRIEVTFQIDEDGILNVHARNAESGAEQAIRIEDPLGLQQQECEEPSEAVAPDLPGDGAGPSEPGFTPPAEGIDLPPEEGSADPFELESFDTAEDDPS